MTTTSANIAGVIKPLGEPLKRCACSGKVYSVDELTGKKRKKKKKKAGVYELLSIGGMSVMEVKKEKKYTVSGKLGVWRTVNGRHYFFPDDKSGSIPPFPKGE